jgi:cell division protein FtsB
MVIRTRLRRLVSIAAFYSIVLGGSTFFVLNAWTGERGLVARQEYKQRIAQLNRQLDELKLERGSLERRVEAISYDAVDRDLLEERARAVLNLGHRGDVIIPLDR